MPLMNMADAIVAGLAGSGSASVAAFAAFAQAAAPVAVAALWQGAAVAVALVLCLRLAPRVSAAHRFAAWAAGFSVVAGLPFLPLLAHSGDASAATMVGEAAARPWLELDSRWGFTIAALWLAASGFRAAELAMHSLRLRRLWKGATPVEADASLRSLLASVSSARPIEICTTRELNRPSVIGFLAPRILVPDWLYSRLTPGELEQVVLHEAEHLRRRDDWTNLLQKLLLVLFPLNPALAWMERQLCREREMACDEGVVRHTQAPRAYAACLTTLAERGLQRRELLPRAQALSLGAFERRPELVHRVHSILRRKQALHPLAAGVLVGVVGCGLVVGSVELARSPQLVAFVAAPKLDAQTAMLAPQAGTAGVAETDAVFHPSTQFRAIETKAVVSANRGVAVRSAAPMRRSEESPAAPTTEEASSHTVAARAELVKAVEPTSAAAAAQSQGFVVLAAWVEVQTSSPKTRAVADYETGESAPKQTGAATSQPKPNRGAQITVTRMILLVCPAGSAAGSQPAPTAFDARRHAASSIDSGWLVFQL